MLWTTASAVSYCDPSVQFTYGPFIVGGPTGDSAVEIGCSGPGGSSTPDVVVRVNGSGQIVSNANFASANNVSPEYLGISPGNQLAVGWGPFFVGEDAITVQGGASFSAYNKAIFYGEQLDALGNLYVLAQTKGGGPVTLDASITLPGNAAVTTWLVREGPSGPKVYGITAPASYLADGQAGVFYHGALTSTLNLGCGPMVPTSPSSGYLARLDPLGACLYANLLPIGPLVIADGQGGVLLYSDAKAPMDLGCGTKSVAPGGSTVFARLDGAGTCVFGGSFDMTLLNFRFGPGGTVVVSGIVPGTTVDLGTGPLLPIGIQDLVVASIDPLGNVLGARRFGAPGLMMHGSVTQSQKGDIYIKTSYPGAVDFGGGPVTALYGDFVMVSLSPSCGHRWSRALPIIGAYDTVVDGCGGLVVVSRDPAFDPGGGTFIPTNVGKAIGFARFQP